jgi:alcohol dehydrogenase (cytochrome c)
VNRGLAILGDTLYMGTIDAHLLAIDAHSGELRWKVKVAEAAEETQHESPPSITS